MDEIDEYCRTLSKESFNKLSPKIQSLFYRIAINNVNTNNIYQQTLKNYTKLLLSAGIYDRIFLGKITNCGHDRYIPTYKKAILKAMCIQNILNAIKIPINSVYFYDDRYEIYKVVKGFIRNSFLIRNGLEYYHLDNLIKRKILNPKSVQMILLDFDGTISLTKVKEKYQNNLNIIDKFMGGKYRLQNLFLRLKKLEEMGVIIGIITFNLKNRIKDLLIKMEWVDENFSNFEPHKNIRLINKTDSVLVPEFKTNINPWFDKTRKLSLKN